MQHIQRSFHFTSGAGDEDDDDVEDHDDDDEEDDELDEEDEEEEAPAGPTMADLMSGKYVRCVHTIQYPATVRALSFSAVFLTP